MGTPVGLTDFGLLKKNEAQSEPWCRVEFTPEGAEVPEDALSRFPEVASVPPGQRVGDR